MRLRHFYGEWGQILAGQTNSLFMDIDVFPNTIDYWGPSGMVFYRNVQIRWTPYKTENSHFAIAIERPSNDIDSGNLRLIEGLEDVDVRNDEELPDLTAQFRYGGDWGHMQLGGILRKVGYELRADPADSWTEGSETGLGHQRRHGVQRAREGRDPPAGRLRRRHRQLHERRRHGPRPVGELGRWNRGGSRSRGGPAHGRAGLLRPLLERQVVEFDRLQLHGSGQHQLPGPGRVPEDRLRLGQPAVLPGREPDGGRAN